jgi:D-aspartate ligase
MRRAPPDDLGPSAVHPTAVVVGLDTPAGLHTARLLARRGLEVVAVVSDRRHPACRTRAVRHVVVADRGGEGLLTALGALAPSLDGAVLYPCTDDAVRTLADERVRLRGFRLVLPGRSVLDVLGDRDLLAAHAEARGLPVARRRTARNVSEVVTAADELEFPCEVDDLADAASGDARGTLGTYADARHLIHDAERLLTAASGLRIRERLPGPAAEAYLCHAYLSPRGIPLRTFVARHVRQWPPLDGRSALAEAVHDEAVRDLAVRTLASLPFFGLATVEVRRDTVAGRDVLVRVVPGRPTERSGMAEAGGVELLHTLYLDALGEPLPAHGQRQVGSCRWIDVGRDLRAALYHVRRAELTPREWLRSLRSPLLVPSLDLGDPGPLVASLARRLRGSRRLASRPSVGGGTRPRVGV